MSQRYVSNPVWTLDSSQRLTQVTWLSTTLFEKSPKPHTVSTTLENQKRLANRELSLDVGERQSQLVRVHVERRQIRPGVIQ